MCCDKMHHNKIQLLFATQFIILHTGHFPALFDPTLLISIFNYSCKLEEILYLPCKSPYKCLEKDEMP